MSIGCPHYISMRVNLFLPFLKVFAGLPILLHTHMNMGTGRTCEDTLDHLGISWIYMRFEPSKPSI